jgi:hypothetical protein
VEMPDCRPESRQVAASMLDGSFGRKKTPSSEAPSVTEPATEAMSSSFDYAQATHYLRG